MPSLQIRDLPDELYEALKAAAKQERRSLSQQAIVTLALGLGATGSHKMRRQAILAQMVSQPDAVWGHLSDEVIRYVREDRDER